LARAASLTASVLEGPTLHHVQFISTTTSASCTHCIDIRKRLIFVLILSHLPNYQFPIYCGRFEILERIGPDTYLIQMQPSFFLTAFTPYGTGVTGNTVISFTHFQLYLPQPRVVASRYNIRSYPSTPTRPARSNSNYHYSNSPFFNSSTHHLPLPASRTSYYPIRSSSTQPPSCSSSLRLTLLRSYFSIIPCRSRRRSCSTQLQSQSVSEVYIRSISSGAAAMHRKKCRW
jgi:hypothetical protein